MAPLFRRTTPLWLVTAVLTTACAPAAVGTAHPPTTPQQPRPERVSELSPIVVSPYTDADLAREFERAQKLLLAGKYREAAELFDRLVRLAPDGEVAPPSLYNGGLAREGLGDREEALSRYQEFVRRFPEHPLVKTGLVRSTRLLGYLERWDALSATADQLMQRADLSLLEAVEARGQKALGLIEQDHLDEAAREVAKARDVIEEHRLGEAGKPPIELAPVSFALGEVRRRKSETIVFTPLPADFTDALEKRCQGLLDAQGAYTEAMRGMDAHWSAMAGYRVGQLYQVLHRDIMQIAPPTKATTLKDKQLFEGAMRLRYRVLLEKGLKMMEGTVRLGDRTGESSLWIVRAKEAKQALDLALQDEKTAMSRLPFTEAQLQAALDSLKTPELGFQVVVGGAMAIAPHFLLPDKPFASYADYLDAVGESAIEAARAMGADAVMQQLKRSALRGRGGAGFPAAVKWRSVESHPSESRVVACNAAEGEPGTFKDRYLIRRNPYAVIEGLLIAAFVVRARDVYIAIKASFTPEIERLKSAVQEITAAGLLSYHEIHFVEGPEEYLFGEEKALVEVIEGNDPLPREPHYPPYERGPFSTPTNANPALVNNAETYAHVPSIVRLGGASFAEIGTPDTTGTILFTVSGDVTRPGVYELPAGITLRKLFYDVAGGPKPGRTIKAVLSGVSAAIVTPDKLDVPADFASLALIGSGLGSAGFVVLDSTASIPRVTQSIARFLYVESCNQCSACKHGLGIASGAIDELFDPELATTDDYERALYGARSAPQGNRCYLPVQGSIVVPGLMTRFRSEFQAQLAQPDGAPEPYLVPKMIDFDEATRTFRYDTDQPRKRPDWTYEAPLTSIPPKSGSPGKRKRVPQAIRLAPDVRDALVQVVKQGGGDPERVVNEALRQWLKDRGA